LTINSVGADVSRNFFLTSSDSSISVTAITNGQTLTVNKTVLSQIGTGGGLPSLVLGTGAQGAGTGSSSVLGTNAGFKISITTAGTPAASGIVFTATFSNPFATVPYPVVSAANSAANLLTGVTNPYISSSTTTTFVFTAGTTGLVTATTYIWNFVVLI
jgi:hypothetical protein